MADYAIPKAATAFIFYGALISQADTKLFKSAPTLAAGDFKVSIDGGAFANLATLPTNTPGTFAVKFALSAGEMTGDNILVIASDAAGAEWCDQSWNIQTSPRGIADLAFPTVSGRSLGVEASGKATGVVLTDTLTTYTGDTPQTGDSFARIGALGAGLTALGDARIVNLDATVSSRMATYAQPAGFLAATFPAGTVANTTNITAGTVTTVSGNVTGSVGSVLGAVGSVAGLTAANLDATISSRATPAQVNAEVVDALATDTYAEPAQGAPSATATLAAKIGYLFKAWRNKTEQTATTYSLYDDAGATVDQKSTVSDDAVTFTRGEIASGP